MKWHRKHHRAVFIGSIVLAFFVGMVAAGDPVQREPPESDAAEASDALVEDASEAEALSSDALRESLTGVLGVDRVADVSMAEVPDAGYRVLVEARSSQSFSGKWARDVIMRESGDVWEHVFAREEVDRVTIAWLGDVEDARGNVSEATVLRVGFERESWEATDWDRIAMDDRAKSTPDEYHELIGFE